MEKQFNNDIININNLEQGKTGNADLDHAISNAKEEPLIFSVEEANYLVENAMTNDVTSSVIKNTIIIGGTVLLSAVFGWMYYEFNHEAKTNQHINTSSKSSEHFNGSERNRIKMSSSTTDFSEITTDNTQLSETASNVNASEINNNRIQQNLASNGNSLTANNNANSNAILNTVKKTGISADKQSVKTSNEDTKKPNSNFSKTIITQRYFDDGSAKMSLEYKNQPARITINSRGIESLFINSEEIDPSYYYLYEDLAAEAFRRSKIEPLAGPTNDANAKPNINAMMAGALSRRGLIKDGEQFNFELTNSSAILNNISLKSDVHKDLLQVYQYAFGSSLPRGGKFIIGKKP
ncbi:MAG: hypothetical protein RL516_430 [Bacteroidota bacterium]|jgi:hypothetical protein